MLTNCKDCVINAEMSCSKTPAIIRFWKHVSKKGSNECWEWIGGSSDYYPNFWNGKKQINAHRFILQIKLKRELTDQELACHTCDNKRCVNPKHLFAGSDLDNSRDMVNKGRKERGALVHGAKLKATDVLKIRKAYADGSTALVLAKLYDVTEANIYAIVKGRSWGHVGGPICYSDMRKVRNGGDQYH